VFARDRWGKPTSVTRSGWDRDINGNWGQLRSLTRSFVYDDNQRLCKRIDPEHGASVMDYDSANRLAWSADGQNLSSTSACNRESVPISARVTRSYNNKDELLTVNYPDSTDDISYSYFADGKLQTANVGPIGSQISRSYSYNNRRLPTNDQLLVDGQSFNLGYRYNNEGALSELGYPDGVWEALSPDGLGRPRSFGQFASNLSWHRFGPLAGLTYSNGMSFSQTLNTRGLPLERTDSRFGQLRLQDGYAWDANGNLSVVNDKVGDAALFRNASRWLQYDGLNRLVVADSSPQPPLNRGSPAPFSYSWGEARFGYDGLDNIRQFKMAALNFSYSYTGNGLLSSVVQSGTTPMFNYGHNARGQMTQRQFNGENFTLNWDSGHRLTQTYNDAYTKVENYRYDAHGHRVRTVRGGETVYQVYSQGGDLLFERSGSTTRTYGRIAGRLVGETQNGVRRAIHTDVIGSVRQKTDALGTLVHEDVRAPYGSALLGSSYQNGPAFTGHMEDGGTGLTYMKARYYDPVAMRFLSPDPVYVDLTMGGNFNRYWYANNNPYTFVDPDGRCGTNIEGNSSVACKSFGGREYEVISRTQQSDGSIQINRHFVSDNGIANDGAIEEAGTVRLLPQNSANGDAAEAGERIMTRLLNFSERERETVEVTSGQRTQVQNAAVGGAPNSQHLHDNAADIRISGYSRTETAAAAHLSGEFNRVNEYPDDRGVHVDLRSTGPQGFFYDWQWQQP